MLPPQLQETEFRFILVKGKDKKPLEKDWTKTANYKFDDSKLLTHLQQGGNLGVACGFGHLLVVDFDDESLQSSLIPKLPSTFTVKSGGGLLHLYFKSNKVESFKILDAEKNTLADIQGLGKQIIAPGSIHPNGNEYTVVKDEPLAFIDYSELQAVFSQWTEVKPVRISNDDSAVKIKGKISVSEMLNSLGVNTSKNPTTCPFHASKGGKCLSFDDSKGVWHCFHCDQAGDIFNLYMLDKNCDFKTAIADLGKRCGFEPKETPKVPLVTLTAMQKIEEDKI
ncbi:MAG: bifunctional DNA primase/polymerase, partial [Candidatus Bathyarchaeota archaeon]|nr:bifunctional DNA primase/polymerase [Candidatus Bathyarchaeota archaeon]